MGQTAPCNDETKPMQWSKHGGVITLVCTSPSGKLCQQNLFAARHASKDTLCSVSSLCI